MVVVSSAEDELEAAAAAPAVELLFLFSFPTT